MKPAAGQAAAWGRGGSGRGTGGRRMERGMRWRVRTSERGKEGREKEGVWGRDGKKRWRGRKRIKGEGAR